MTMRRPCGYTQGKGDNMQHYYTARPNSGDKPDSYTLEIAGRRLEFSTNSGVFSKAHADTGSVILIKALINENLSGRVLDLGCGIGTIGVTLAALNGNIDVVMADINERAAELAHANARKNRVAQRCSAVISDAFAGIEGKFNAIVTNPPIRAGKAVVYSFFQGAYEHLMPGGAFYCVIRKKQGAPSSMEKLKEIFGNCEVIDRDAGYYILRCVKY